MSMTCRAWQDLLQRHLDGEGPPEALDRHLHDCADCAAQTTVLRRLLDGLGRLKPATPPAHLCERLVGRLCAERRVRRRMPWRRIGSLASLAAAAALLVAVGVWSWRPITGKPAHLGQGFTEAPRPADEPAPPLRDSMNRAGQAVAALTSRTASDTVETTTTLLPLVGGSALGPLANPPAVIEPTAEPIREAVDGVSSGLAPVADSARRAVHLFFRNLPMPPGNGPAVPDKQT
jgi:hypothetical protein